MSGSVRYTQELLAEAAKQCTTIDEVIAFCGGRPYHQLRRHLAKRFEHFGIDVSHFRPIERRTSHPRPARAALQQAVSASQSVAAALRRLGKPVNSRTRALFHRWAAEYAVDTCHFLGQAHQRGKPDFDRLAPTEILVKHDRGRRTQTSRLRRALMEIGVAEQCVECGTGPSWNGRPMTLEIDHINGDWSDDRAGNLRLLCPNCHAATDTWCRGGRRRTEAA
ncbi:HNH endonuclease signature motif containing protein [Streptomyces sioyaensis]|uniref:HNH endonuclease signature motif containing protein n=1 Tax=Streptomyces sioyaensis TaxID=67364 RepID=UPI0036B4595E